MDESSIFYEGDIGITALLYRVAHKYNNIQDEKLKEFSISLPQAVILAIIGFKKDIPINQKTLSDIMMVKESSVSSIIKTMVKNGLITKEQSKTDGRNQILRITSQGYTIVEKIKKYANEIQTELYSKLTDDEKTTLINLLKKLA